MSERRLLSLGTNTFQKTIKSIQKCLIWLVNVLSMGSTQAFMSIYLQIMKSFSVCTPPIKFLWRYLGLR